MPESQDASLLQRRARRRLVGAIALVVLVVTVLPIVLEKEPGPMGTDLLLQIPSQDAGKFKTRVLPQSASESGVPERAPEPAKAAPAAKEDSPAPSAAMPAASGDKPAPPPEVRVDAFPAAGAPKDAAAAPPPKAAASASSDAARAQALLEGKGAWVVKLGAFSNEANVRQLRDKMAAAGVKSYTEPVKGPKGDQTRVRAGPFDTRQDAEQAQEKLKAAGVSPGTVGPR